MTFPTWAASWSGFAHHSRRISCSKSKLTIFPDWLTVFKGLLWCLLLIFFQPRSNKTEKRLGPSTFIRRFGELLEMDWKIYISPFLSIFLTLIQITLAELTPEECRDLGFSVNLICSSCDELKPFNLTSEPSLEQNCRKCCQADGQEEATKVCVR